MFNQLFAMHRKKIILFFDSCKIAVIILFCLCTNDLMAKETDQRNQITHNSYTNISKNKVAGTITISITKTDATCGKDNGNFIVIASGGTAPYTYSANGLTVQHSGIFAGKGAGVYNIIVEDANGETANSSVTLLNTFPRVNLNETTLMSPDICSGTNGTLTLEASAGTPPYLYTADGYHFQSSNTISNLSVGSYNFVVQDANGCTSIFGPVRLGNPCTIQLEIAYPGSTCIDDGYISCGIPNGGTAPYQFSLDGISYQNSREFLHLISGIYRVHIKDATGLVSIVSVQIFQSCDVNATAISTVANCGKNDGTVTVNAANGMAPYTYSLDGINFQQSNIFSGLSAGSYTVAVLDGSGKFGYATNIIVGTNCSNASAVITNTTCGKNNGMIIASASNGIAPYQFSIDGINFQTNDTFSNLAKGNYLITIKDAIGNLFNSNAIVGETQEPDIFANSFPALCTKNNGEIIANVQGGTSPLQYSIDNGSFQDSGIFNNLTAGNYIATVKDSNGCTASVNVNVPTDNNAKVFAGNDTAVAINHSLQLHAIDINNVGFTKYEWLPSFGLNNAITQNPIANINRDITYIVVASTSDGCEGRDSISIKTFSLAEIFVPSAFTANTDGHNDILKAIPVGIKEFKYFAVYNRNGRQIFYTSNPSVGWDGKINGVAQGTGVFVWVASGVDFSGNNIERKGTVTLIR